MILSPNRHEKGLWWDRNWPVLEGCTPCSPACDNCFASGYAHRFENSLPYLRGLTNTDGKWNGTVALRKDQLKLPSTIKKPTVWFVTERSDLFHPAVPFEYILGVLTYAVIAPHHRYMILTKRPERMAEFFKWMDTEAPHRVETMRDCFWFVVTVWDQDSADRSIPLLLSIPVARRFISIEPLLGPVDLTSLTMDGANGFYECDALDTEGTGFYTSSKILGSLDFVIVGGESGLDARPTHPNWIRFLRDQCAAAKVPFFFKQWGEWAGGKFDRRKGKMICQPSQSGNEIGRIFWTNKGCPKVHLWDEADHYWTHASAFVGKKAAGRLIDGKEYLELPL